MQQLTKEAKEKELTGKNAQFQLGMVYELFNILINEPFNSTYGWNRYLAKYVGIDYPGNATPEYVKDLLNRNRYLWHCYYSANRGVVTNREMHPIYSRKFVPMDGDFQLGRIIAQTEVLNLLGQAQGVSDNLQATQVPKPELLNSLSFIIS